MKKIIFPLLFLTAALSLFSCFRKKNREKEEFLKSLSSSSHYFDSIRHADSLAEFGTPTDVTYAELMNEANKGKRVSVEGYISLPSSSMISDESVQLSLVERPGQFTSPFNFIADIKVGKSNNTMNKIPTKYNADDVLIRGNKGEEILVGDRVKITGKLTVYGTFASMDVQVLEKLDPVKIDYASLGATKITAANMNDTALEKHFVYAEGMLEIPMLTMGGTYTFLYLNLPGGQQLTIDIKYGDRPGCMEAPPKDYSDNDIHIYDDNGKAISLKRKVRVYGDLSYERINVESINNI